MIPKATIEKFQKEILDWYAKHQRDLPWRKSRDPYRILVSEVMLQQTQVSRVIPKFENWLKRFPTVFDLSKATVADILVYWSGLGYNRRALNLKKIAEVIVQQYDGKFPHTEKELLALPGIGQYTARAIMCFAFDQQVVVVDTNVRKVISVYFSPERNFVESKGTGASGLRLHSGKNNLDDRMINDIAEQLLPYGKAYTWNQALMDYSSVVLKKEKILIPKQSKFLGSHRFYRGQVLKVLLKKKKVKVAELGSLIKKEYADADTEWLKKLLEELVKEGFIVIKKEYVLLVS